MSNTLLTKPLSVSDLLPPNYVRDEESFHFAIPWVRPAWLKNESIKSLDRKFPMAPGAEGSIVFYTTPLGKKVRMYEFSDLI